MKPVNLTLVWVHFLLSFIACTPDTAYDQYSLFSPDKKTELILSLQEGKPFYALRFANDTLISQSPLGLILSQDIKLAQQLQLDSISRSEVNETVFDHLGERSSFPNHYQEMRAHLSVVSRPEYQLTLVFRAFNEGVAMRYFVPSLGANDTLRLLEEKTAFHFADKVDAFAEYGHEGMYERVTIGEVREKCEIPLLTLGEGYAAAINEAALENYSRMFLQPDTSARHALKVMLNSPVRLQAPFQTPWRVIQLAETPGQLLDQNYLIQALAPPSRLADTSWIRAGKAMRVVTDLFTTEESRRVVDFVADKGLDYVEFDAGWYGKGYGIPNESDPESDASSVISGLDLPTVVDYARDRGIGTILYVNKVALEQQIDAILPLYRDWGIAGLKFGFVDGRTQQGINRTHAWVQKAAEHRMIVDIHDNYRPSGMSRTFPNLLTQEGIRGNEHMPTATHNTLLPFTRYISGAGDYTICYLNDRLQTTPAHQLALGVIYFSPLHFIYWYGRPEDYPQAQGTTFFRNLPTTWDESRFLMGEPGTYVAMARRKGESWHAGVITNEEARKLKLPLSFLGEGLYQLRLYVDAAEADVKLIQQKVSAQDTLQLDLLASGGAALRLVPVESLSPPLQPQ
jgi:alpha-glucosidase